MIRPNIRGYEMMVLAGIVAITAITFVADVILPLGRNFWQVYFLAVVLSFTSRRIWLPFPVVGVIILLLAAGLFIGAEGPIPGVSLLNRSLGAGIMVILAFSGALMIHNRLQLTAHDWEQRAEVRLAQQLLGDLTAEQIARRSLTMLCEFLEARAATAFIVENKQLVRIGSWGLDETAGEPPASAEGQGHLWRAITENRLISLAAPPETALGWRSSLLKGRAVHSVMIPTASSNGVTGVIEIGLDAAPDNRALHMLEQASKKIGVELRSARYREDLRALLEETRRQAEQLHSHGEELAASNEELEEQALAMQATEVRLRDQQAELEEQNAQLEMQTQQLSDQRDALARSRRQLADQAEELARESRYKSEFVANMSHELRTPLNALLIMARLLGENRMGNLTPEQVQWAETIESSGKDLVTLINDILDLARIEAGKVDITPEPVSPDGIATRLRRAFEMQAREHGLELNVEMAVGAPKILTDAARVEQILRNFMSNALKFTEKGGITLGVTQVPDGVAFWVRDTGIGIAPDQQQAVFEAFRQADGTISRRFGGTGLGLSISRDLAELLGGRITVESALGQGSTFTLHLPINLPADLMPDAASGPRSSPSPAGTVTLPPINLPTGAGRAAQGVRSRRAGIDTTAVPSSPRLPAADLGAAEGPLGQLPGLTDDRDTLEPKDRILLVVEDDATFARVLLDLARELDFRALVVGTADDAIRAAQRYQPHGIVLDVGLPDHSGLTVLDRLKRDAATRHIPVHIVSAEDHTREALAQGAVSYLLKPVAREALVQALEGLGHRMDQRLRRVLIVEDDPAQLDGLRELLKSDDVETRGVSTAAEAIEICRETTFDCIVLDMTLPDGSGLDLLEKLSEDETAPFPPVIVYTARILTETEEQRLRRYSRSIIIKGAKSPERLIDEVTLFLHQVVSDLPARQREMLAASLNRDANLEGRRILVVEDDIRNIYALSGVFEPHGVAVQIARNGREALEALGRCADGGGPKIDLVLMDVMMPEMDGLTATREIRRIDRWKSLPIIMLTAKAMADDHAQCLAAGANDYLSKPLDVDKLLSLARVWMPR